MVKVYEWDVDRNVWVQGLLFDLYEDLGLVVIEVVGLLDVFWMNYMLGVDCKKLMDLQVVVYYSDYDKLEE